MSTFYFHLTYFLISVRYFSPSFLASLKILFCKDIIVFTALVIGSQYLSTRSHSSSIKFCLNLKETKRKSWVSTMFPLKPRDSKDADLHLSRISFGNLLLMKFLVSWSTVILMVIIIVSSFRKQTRTFCSSNIDK